MCSQIDQMTIIRGQSRRFITSKSRRLQRFSLTTALCCYYYYIIIIMIISSITTSIIGPTRSIFVEAAAENNGEDVLRLRFDTNATTGLGFYGEPANPSAKIPGVGGDHINVTWIPGNFDPADPKPIGEDHYIKVRPQGSTEWREEHPTDKNFTVQVKDLDPGTVYEIVTVSVTKDEATGEVMEESTSPSYYVTTTGERPTSATAAWLIVIIVAIIILIIILIIVCLVVRNRGAKYPVSEKEREQGREPMLGKEEKGFGEYTRPDVEEEKRSLTGGSIAPSETDSMAQYGDAEAGGFAEDGSFIGQYINSTTAQKQQQGAGAGAAGGQPTVQYTPAPGAQQQQAEAQQQAGGTTKSTTFV